MGTKRSAGMSSDPEHKRRAVETEYGYPGVASAASYGYPGAAYMGQAVNPMMAYCGYNGKSETKPHEKLPPGTPVNTLFVSNIDPSIPRPQLDQQMSLLPGFVRVKHGKGSNPTAFVEFADTGSSTQALALLDGRTVGDCPTPLAAQYARSTMKGP
eukprot:NODE_4959_length_613_cov_119.952128_g4274_i0.p1 GENE.NODE_4959_length_613_cov_119.952128_g4274_i0~~NODE_4959_length_613_cov_119.952128_g4274_i0.p1  ORF type:complete len:164 (+),score=41.10 NODE_4959_length_613_cov_119.952128_g4274_i0:26-493(+)